MMFRKLAAIAAWCVRRRTMDGLLPTHWIKLRGSRSDQQSPTLDLRRRLAPVKGLAVALILMCAFIHSEAVASFPSALIKWNPQDDKGVAGWKDSPEDACKAAIVYGIRYNYLPSDSVYDHVEPRPGYEAVQQSCYAKWPPNWTPYYSSVVLLMGSCDGGNYYVQGQLTCPCPANSTASGASCKCNDGWTDDPVGGRSCKPLDESKPCAACGPGTSDPITFGTGNKWLVENDFGGANGESLAFTRRYNSKPNAFNPALGVSWSFDYGQRLGFGNPTGAVWAYRPDGRGLKFLASGSNYVADADITDRLYREGTTGYRLETGSHVERYDNAGRLTSRTDRLGRTQTFTYDAQNRMTTVADHVGRELSFAYDSQGRISLVTDPAGRKVTYTYDAANNLSTVTYPDLKTKTYHYNEPGKTSGANLPHALTGVTDENGSRYMSYTYDSSGRAIEEVSPSVGSNVKRHQMTYGTDGTTVTNPLGIRRTYRYQTVLGVPRFTGTDQPAGSGGAPATSTMVQDANGNVTSKTDVDGNVTTYSYDVGRNLETQRVEGSGTPNARTITTEWHGVWRLPSRIAEPKKITSYIYNGDVSNGQQVTCAPAGATILMGGVNQSIGVLCSQTEQATTDSTGSSGLSAPTDTGVAPRTWSFAYDAAGRVLTKTDPLGRVTNQAYYNATTFVPEPFDPHIKAVTLLLHADGLQGSTVVPDDSTYHRSVSPYGGAQLGTAQSKFGSASITLNGTTAYLTAPSSSDFDFAGDFCVEAWIKPTTVAGTRLIVNRQQSGTSAAFQFRFDNGVLQGILRNTAGNIVGAGGGTITAGVWQHVAFCRSGSAMALYIGGNVVGTASSSISAAPSAARPLILGGYDDGAATCCFFAGYIDDLRVTSGIARYTSSFTPPTHAFPNTGLARPLPDAVGQRAGDLQSITDAAGQVRQFNLYDAAGRIRQVTDSKGVVTDITYTPRGWVSTVTVTPPGGLARLTTYTYDGLGQLIGASHPDGTAVTYTYDAAHRLTGITDARGNSVAYTLDAEGNRISEEIRDPSGTLQRAIGRSFDALNRVQQVTGSTQ